MLFILGAIIGLFSSFVSTLLGGGAGLIATPAFFYIIVHIYGADSAMQVIPRLSLIIFVCRGRAGVGGGGGVSGVLGMSSPRCSYLSHALPYRWIASLLVRYVWSVGLGRRP